MVGQIIAKLHRKKRRLSGEGAKRFLDLSGADPDSFIRALKDATPEEAARLLLRHRALIEMLDTRIADAPILLPISHHPDAFRREETGYGPGITRPEDYIESFRTYLAENLNRIPALAAVATRPRDLTREVAVTLQQAGFGEETLRAAFRATTNADIAASIIGYIRQAALDDPLVPYAERVDRAMGKLLTSRPWTPPQRQWLERIARQLKTELIVDKDTLDQGEFHQQGGGFARLNRVFDGRLEAILAEIGDGVWERVASQ